MTPILVGCIFAPGTPAAARQRFGLEILVQAGLCGVDQQLVQVLGCEPDADRDMGDADGDGDGDGSGGGGGGGGGGSGGSGDGRQAVRCLFSATAGQLREYPGLRDGLCRSYARDGWMALSEWQAPWSLMLWDGRRRQLVLCRDPMGIAPVYYGTVGTVDGSAAAATPLAVACSSLALLARIMPALAGCSEAAIADQLLGTFLPAHATIYRDLHAVPPGCGVVIGAQGQVQRHRLWHLPEPGERRSDREAMTPRRQTIIAEALLDHLRRAVTEALGDGPSGSWLSAGLDSSVVTALAVQALGSAPAGGGVGVQPPLATWSLRFPGLPQSDEGPYLAAFHRRFSTRRHEIGVTDLDPLAHLPALAQACGQPLLMGNSCYAWLLARATAASGCRNVLTGHDGDSVFGYRTMHLGDLVRQGQIGRALGTWALLAHHQCLPRRRLFTDSVWSPLLQRLRRTLGERMRMPRPHTAALADLLERTGAWQRAEAQWAGLAQHAISAREEHYRELTSASLAQATTFFAHLGQAHGIAIRHPLLDVRLVAFCHRLPASAMNDHGWTRYAVRQAMAGILPEELRWRRRKADLSVPLYKALSEHGQDTARSLLSSPGLRPYVRPEGIESLLGALAGTPWQQLDDESLPGIWNLLWLAAWLPGTLAEQPRR